MPKPVSLTFFNCTLCVFIVSYNQRFGVGDYSKALKQYKFANYQTATPKPLLTEIYTEPRKKLSLGLLKNILFLQWYVNSPSFWVLRTIRWAKEMILFTYTACPLSSLLSLSSRLKLHTLLLWVLSSCSSQSPRDTCSSREPRIYFSAGINQLPLDCVQHCRGFTLFQRKIVLNNSRILT